MPQIGAQEGRVGETLPSLIENMMDDGYIRLMLYLLLI